MIILPDKNIPRSRFLMPVKKREWMPPSYTQFKDQLGNDGIRTIFCIRARLHDGHVVWRGTFRDREDFDAFLFATFTGSLRYERELWKLPTPWWHPDIGEELSYDFATVTFLTTTGSNLTYTSPSDWDNSTNEIECVGGGASGGAIRTNSSGAASGGGGGAYSSITNFSFASPGSTTATYNVGAGGIAVSTTGAGVAGNNGNPVWFNNTANPGNGSTNAQCSAAGGTGGKTATTGSAGQATGGATTASWGQTKFNGGKGATGTTGGPSASGGGGAGGPNGAGSNSGNATNTSTNGGSGDAGSGGSGGALKTGGGTATNGGNGTEFDATHGSGGGGGGAVASTNTATTGGSGGNYGGAGGAACINFNGTPTVTSGAGIQGIIVITYTPLAYFSQPNLAMIGM